MNAPSDSSLADGVTPLAYATPVTRKGISSAWAAVLLLAAALGLLVVGGCFLIGVMLIVTHGWFNQQNRPLTPAENILIAVLYALAFLTLGSGAYLLILLLRNLRPILEGRAGH